MEKSNVLLNFSTSRGSRDEPVQNSWTLTCTCSEKGMSLMGLHQSTAILDLIGAVKMGLTASRTDLLSAHSAFWGSCCTLIQFQGLLYPQQPQGFIYPKIQVWFLLCETLKAGIYSKEIRKTNVIAFKI